MYPCLLPQYQVFVKINLLTSINVDDGTIQYCLALSSITSKVFEHLILLRLEEYLWTTDIYFLTQDVGGDQYYFSSSQFYLIPMKCSIYIDMFVF